MATTSKALSRTAAATTSTTLYTVPSGTTTIVTNIAVTNSASTAGTFTITLDGVELFKDTAISANSIAIFDLKQTIDATKVIAGLASATTVKFHISGVEIN